MIGIYKRGGPHKKNGLEYSFLAVSKGDLDSYLSNGWVKDFSEVAIEDADFKPIAESGSDHETELRDKIKALGGKAAGRSSIETLEKQLKELQDGSDS